MLCRLRLSQILLMVIEGGIGSIVGASQSGAMVLVLVGAQVEACH